MHDQVKVVEAAPDDETKRQRSAAIDAFNALREDVMGLRAAKAISADALTTTRRFLEANSENYTIWAYRREVLQGLWRMQKIRDEEASLASVPTSAVAAPSDVTSATNAEATSAAPSVSDASAAAANAATAQRIQADLISELEFSTAVLKKEYKSYCAWLHRKWIITSFPNPAIAQKVLTKENAKCEELLKADERNFHAWGYRRWVTDMLRQAGAFNDEMEMTFTLGKIEQNFSNYSAWHNRALIISKLMVATREAADVVVAATESPPVPPSATNAARDEGVAARHVQAEVDYVVKALYCDPFDQSAWFYAEFLLSATAQAFLRSLQDAAAPHAGPSPSPQRSQQLYWHVQDAFMNAATELLSMEPEAKWVWWLKRQLLQWKLRTRAAAKEANLAVLRPTFVTGAMISALSPEVQEREIRRDMVECDAALRRLDVMHPAIYPLVSSAAPAAGP